MSTPHEGIELSVVKQEVREKIMQQVTLLARKKDRNLHMFTLPGQHGSFESMIIKYCQGNDIKIQMRCAENVTSVFKAYSAIKPPEVDLRNGPMSERVFDPIYEQAPLFDAIWADFCEGPKKHIISNCADQIETVLDDQGIYYVTFCLQGRKVTKLGVLLQIRGCKINREEEGVDSYQLRDSVAAAFLSECSRRKLRIRKVFDVIYGGGTAGSTVMMTLGFTKGISSSWLDIPKVSIDRLHEQRAVRKHQKRESGKNVDLRQKVFARFQSGFTSETIGREFSLSLNQVRGMKAHYNKRVVQGKPWKNEIVTKTETA